MAGFDGKTTNDYRVKVILDDPQSGVLAEKLKAAQGSGIILNVIENENTVGKVLEISFDASYINLMAKLIAGANISITEGQGELENHIVISAPDVGKVKTFAGDTLKYLLDALANVSDDEITISQGSGDHVGQVVLEIPNIGKVKTDSEDTFDYLNNKIFGTFPIIKKHISVGGIKRVVIESAEKIAFAPNGIRKADWDEYNFGWNTAAHTAAVISTDNTTVNGVNFVVKQANPSTIYIQYQNLSGSDQTLTLYAIPYPTGSSWSQASTFDVDLAVTPSDSVYTAEVEVEGIGDYPIAFLLASSDEVSNIFIYNIYEY